MAPATASNVARVRPARIRTSPRETTFNMLPPFLALVTSAR
jgi:hypothetical protein